MKKCSKCQEYLSKESFYKDKRVKDGLYSCCKSCHTIKNGTHTKTNIEKGISRTEYHRRYRKIDGESIKVQARKSAYDAIQHGRIIKKPCEVCGELKVEAHHEDYSKKLDVIFLCKKHHVQVHCKITHTEEK